MKINIVQVGNSRGIRLPKALLQESGLDKLTEVDIKVKDEKLIITRLKTPRKGWQEAFRKMAMAKDDQLLDKDELGTAWDEEEWEWR